MTFLPGPACGLGENVWPTLVAFLATDFAPQYRGNDGSQAATTLRKSLLSCNEGQSLAAQGLVSCLELYTTTQCQRHIMIGQKKGAMGTFNLYFFSGKARILDSDGLFFACYSLKDDLFCDQGQTTDTS